MATPNYSYEKRQRELAKKRKAEEKRQKKGSRPDGSPSDEGAPQETTDTNAPSPAAPPAN